MPGSPLYKTHTGAEYFKRITALESDRRIRSAFQDLVLRIAPPGASLFDFGAGPGIDARFFAERGFTIGAYDADPKMCEFFSSHCRDLIDSSRVTLEREKLAILVEYHDGPFSRLENAPSTPAVSAV